MPRWLRITSRILLVFIALILILWLGIGWYVKAHKQQLLKDITARLSARTGGTLTIRDMEPSLWKSFPNISIVLKDVQLHDSLYSQHHHNILSVKDLFVKVNTLRLLVGKTEIKKLTAAHGQIFFYTNAAGYSNTYLLSSKDTIQKKNTPVVDAFGMDDIQFYFVNDVKSKLFHIHIKSLDGTTAIVNGIWQQHVKLNAHVYQFCFNTVRGSYLKDKDLDINVALSYDPGKKTLNIPDQRIKISGQPIQFAANFNFSVKPAPFSIHIRSDHMPYKTAVSWLSHNIAKKLDSFDFNRPLAVDGKIEGVMKYRSIPLVRVSFVVEDNRLTGPFGTIEKTSFKGFYYNEAVAGKGHGDDNSELEFHQVAGEWNAIPFTSDTLHVTNLLVPYVNAHVLSEFPLTAINDIVGGNAFTFNTGHAAADIHYIGGILPADSTPHSIQGFVKVEDGALTYLPRTLSFNSVRANVLFKGTDLFLRDVHLKSKGSSISLEGEAMDFLKLYFTDPGKITVNWRATSPLINLNDFLSFVDKRKTATSRRTPAGSTGRIGAQMDKVLNASSIHMDATVDKMIFKNFTASRVIARAALAESGIVIEKVYLQNAGGSINITGVINQSAANNPFTLKADIDHADVKALFHSFDDFGQTAITGNNLGGKLTATANVTGHMSEGGKIVQNSMNGSVDFKLEDGELDHFAPFEKIGRFAFKKRNLSHVTFKVIQNKFLIAGDKITIPPMLIESSAVNMNVQGVYGMPKGTEIFISVPLRNPEKDEARTFVGQLLRKGKGFVVNLRAQDGDKDGVKISWDPLKKGKKALEEQAKP